MEKGVDIMAHSTQISFRIDDRIPFEVSADPFYSESNIRYLEGIMQDIKEGRAHFAEHDLIDVTNEATLGR